MSPRPYAQRARAESAVATRAAILDATIALAYELERIDFPLERIAARARRSVQTILRQFGSRDALIEAAVQRGMAEVVEERRPPDGDIPRALDLLVEHYERRGRFVLRLLAMDDDHDAPVVTAPGKLLHRAWVEEVFAEAIGSSLDPIALTDMLVVVTDVSAWKLLRLDRGLGTREVLERMTAMVDAIQAREPR